VRVRAKSVGGKSGLNPFAGLTALGKQHTSIIDKHIATLPALFESEPEETVGR